MWGWGSPLLEGLMNGTFLMALGEVWTMVSLRYSSAASDYGAGHSGQPWQETLVGIAFRGSASPSLLVRCWSCGDFGGTLRRLRTKDVTVSDPNDSLARCFFKV